MRELEIDPLSTTVLRAREDSGAGDAAEPDEASSVRSESKNESNDEPHLEHDDDCSLFSVLH
ncbi:MAG TPA: hypothetical protein VN745_00865 [Verrucomicrobiae bacterium]|nr:hypothetical protein [Verrucomicrobiae bacterium]